MDFFGVLDERHSVRCFLPKKVGDSELKKILLAANSAPSAGDLQAYKIFVAKSGKAKSAIAASASQDFLREPPVVLVFFADKNGSFAKYGGRGKELYCVQDATIACAYAQLAATALGLSSVWVGGFDPALAKAACGKNFAAENLVPVAVLPVGHSAVRCFATSRKPLSEIVSEEKD